MNGPQDATSESVRDDLLVTVASLYYEHSQNQQQIAERLDVSRSSVSRMIKEARDRAMENMSCSLLLNRNTEANKPCLCWPRFCLNIMDLIVPCFFP